MASPPKPRPLFVTPATRTIKIEGSSHVDEVSYLPQSQVLTVRFRNGSEYDYEGVDYSSAVGLAQAKSAGTFLKSKILPNFAGKRREKP